jgi:signal transduction histidine kinase
MTNLVRHAHARHCRIRLEMNGGLELEVTDDGDGIPRHPHGGVGLASMRERAAELGGSCTVERAPGGGTIVRAHLPVPDAPTPAAP